MLVIIVAILFRLCKEHSFLDWRNITSIQIVNDCSICPEIGVFWLRLTRPKRVGCFYSTLAGSILSIIIRQTTKQQEVQQNKLNQLELILFLLKEISNHLSIEYERESIQNYVYNSIRPLKSQQQEGIKSNVDDMQRTRYSRIQIKIQSSCFITPKLTHSIQKVETPKSSTQ